MADLFRYESESQIFPRHKNKREESHIRDCKIRQRPAQHPSWGSPAGSGTAGPPQPSHLGGVPGKANTHTPCPPSGRNIQHLLSDSTCGLTRTSPNTHTHSHTRPLCLWDTSEHYTERGIAWRGHLHPDPLLTRPPPPPPSTRRSRWCPRTRDAEALIPNCHLGPRGTPSA